MALSVADATEFEAFPRGLQTPFMRDCWSFAIAFVGKVRHNVLSEVKTSSRLRVQYLGNGSDTHHVSILASSLDSRYDFDLAIPINNKVSIPMV